MSKIISAPNPVLSQVAKKYTFKKGDKFLHKFLKDMEDALLSAADPKGVGLAAPQIGKSLSIFIAKPTEKSKIEVFINPQILKTLESVGQIKKRSKKHTKLEGCLSLKDIWGEVKRPDNITISYFDENGKKFTKKLSGFMATIAQHEVDHLEGILFPKRVLDQNGKLYRSSKNEKGEDEFDEIKL